MATETVIKCDHCQSTVDTESSYTLLSPPVFANGFHILILPPGVSVEDTPINAEIDPIEEHGYQPMDLHQNCVPKTVAAKLLEYYQRPQVAEEPLIP